MESQDGISVRPMRLKVLYTFDNNSKTNCLARWPHLLDIQTAALDENTHIGVIELKTCIQAIVSASPELVAQLGQDYTVYAYDYSEYETPLVGQGMLSWVLASSSPTPNAPAHQSKTMVTGRVCKNVLGLFSKGAQETLEVKLRLVPVPTALQREYLDSMQKYRELSNVIPHDFDAQAWTDFLRQNPGLMAHSSQQAAQASSPVDHSGIERFHQILSAGSTPREIMSMPANQPFRSTSPAQSALSTASRVQTPGSQFPIQQQEQPAPRAQYLERSQSDVIRPSSSASMRDADFHSYARCNRRDSIQSGYGSCEEPSEQQPRKRAKLYRADAPRKDDLNIERQPSSLRVAASTAASVRIHRPTPINPLISAAQNSNEEPVRPPTPISDMNHLPRRTRPLPSLLRESSTQSTSLSSQYNSPYAMSDDHPSVEPTTTSPEESRYQGLFEPSFSMPSSPPILDSALPARSSPVLPPMRADLDSGFVSAGIDDLLDDELGSQLESATTASKNSNKPTRPVRSAVQASAPSSVIGMPEDRVSGIADDQPESVTADVMEMTSNTAQNGPVSGAEVPAENFPVSRATLEQQHQQQVKEAPVTLPRASRATSSRPSSRASVRHTPKPLAPAPISQSELEQLLSAIPESDPVLPSDGAAAETPAPTVLNEDSKPRSGTGARRLKQVRQVQLRLERCIREGQAPPYCENCGAIETPTWRRAHSKVFEGSEEDANEHTKDPLVFFWQPVETNEQGKVTKYKVYKKKLTDDENDFALVLLCNPCGIWLQKCKSMRPENRWNKASYEKRKRPRRTRKDGGPLSTNKRPGGRSTSEPSKPDASSPGVSDASSPAADDDATPGPDNDAGKAAEIERQKNDDVQEPSAKRRRANSAEPRKSSDRAGSCWREGDAREALRRAIQSSPAKNLAGGNASAPGERNLPPKPVRRVLFPNSQNEGGPLRALGESVLNSPKRSSRVPGVQETIKEPGEKENQTSNDLDRLFESPSFEFELCASPTPKRRNQRLTAADKRHSIPTVSPARSRRDGAIDTTPTRTPARRLQRVQSSPGSVSHQSRTPGRSRSLIPDLPAIPDDIFGTAAFQGMDDMIVDIFSDNATSAIHTDPLFALETRNLSNNNWADWLPSDLSPSKSDGNRNSGDADIINALLSDADLQKDIFQYPDPRILDSGFFSSDAVQADGMALEKTDVAKDQTTNLEQI
ncbi:hypothetical protein BDW75DRAFT_90790 [Aspergillus navahoensis]